VCLLDITSSSYVYLQLHAHIAWPLIEVRTDKYTLHTHVSDISHHSPASKFARAPPPSSHRPRYGSKHVDETAYVCAPPEAEPTLRAHKTHTRRVSPAISSDPTAPRGDLDRQVRSATHSDMIERGRRAWTSNIRRCTNLNLSHAVICAYHNTRTHDVAPPSRLCRRAVPRAHTRGCRIRLVCSLGAGTALGAGRAHRTAPIDPVHMHAHSTGHRPRSHDASAAPSVHPLGAPQLTQQVRG